MVKLILGHGSVHGLNGPSNTEGSGVKQSPRTILFLISILASVTIHTVRVQWRWGHTHSDRSILIWMALALHPLGPLRRGGCRRQGIEGWQLVGVDGAEGSDQFGQARSGGFKTQAPLLVVLHLPLPAIDAGDGLDVNASRQVLAHGVLGQSLGVGFRADAGLQQHMGLAHLDCPAPASKRERNSVFSTLP